MKKNPERQARDWLDDIVRWGGMLRQHIDGMGREQFERDVKTQHAVMKCIEVLGEASSRLMKDSPSTLIMFPNLEAKAAYAARNRLTHGYFDVSTTVIWNTAVGSAPELVSQARAALADMEADASDD